MSPSLGSEVSLCDVCIYHVYLSIEQELGEEVCLVSTYEVCAHMCVCVCVCVRARVQERKRAEAAVVFM